MTQYSPNVHGRGSFLRATLPALQEEWFLAEEMADRDSATYVPRRSIFIREGVQPRGLNRETVMRYAEEYDALPPITVQRDTFVLIGGRHRLEAAQVAGRVVVRVVELDIPDAELVDAAFRDNLTHGQPYTLEERRAYLRLLLANPANSALSNRDLAERTGLDRDTVSRLRAAAGTPSPHKSNNPAGTTKTIVTGGLPPNREINHKPQPVVRSYDPGPDEEEEQARYEAQVADDWDAQYADVDAQAEAEPTEYEYTVSGTPPAKVTLSTPMELVDTETGEITDDDEGESFTFLLDGESFRIQHKRYGPETERSRRAREQGKRESLRWLEGL